MIKLNSKVTESSTSDKHNAFVGGKLIAR